MNTISMLEFRKQTQVILARVRQGEEFVLTYRGTPMARLQPLVSDGIPDDDPLYMLAQDASDSRESLTNDEMDRLVYDV